MNLIKRIDAWIDSYTLCGGEVDQIGIRIMQECKTEILNLKYELDVINENGAGTIQGLQAEIQRLTTNNEAQASLCQDYAAEIKRLEQHEYASMTVEEWRGLYIKALLRKRAGLRIKENTNG